MSESDSSYGEFHKQDTLERLNSIISEYNSNFNVGQKYEETKEFTKSSRDFDEFERNPSEPNLNQVNSNEHLRIKSDSPADIIRNAMLFTKNSYVLNNKPNKSQFRKQPSKTKVFALAPLTNKRVSVSHVLKGKKAENSPSNQQENINTKQSNNQIETKKSHSKIPVNLNITGASSSDEESNEDEYTESLVADNKEKENLVQVSKARRYLFKIHSQQRIIWELFLIFIVIIN
mmetsp:Transcript_34448/g.39846  ORF Transcript_34448/g.39846 Transcript_34448/m.39846 type:complete len:232 (+) Transcript_34448:7-702(+)